jgi:uncharacterized protein YdeI (YjbR/CyaY-like superfamily)
MKELEEIFFKNGNDFRNWLERNYNTNPGIWMIYNKKHLHTDGVTYDEALDEALCFGWVDSLIKKRDDETYVRKFTPRKDVTKWSELNKKKVIALIEKGKMMQAGLDKAGVFLNTAKTVRNMEPSVIKAVRQLEIPDFILEGFANHEPALTHFNELAPSHKRQYVLWITNARREETVHKRMDEAIRLLKERRELGLK